jgi:hypothetical protein
VLMFVSSDSSTMSSAKTAPVILSAPSSRNHSELDSA